MASANEQELRPATIIEINGELVLDDPMVVAMIRAMGKISCEKTLELNAERVIHFKNRINELDKTGDELVIVLVNVDDIKGSILADILMPNYNWQEIRDRDVIPFARGLADRKAIEYFIRSFDQEAADKLKNLNGSAVVVVDHQVAEIFTA